MLLKFPSWKWSINHAVADCKVLIIRWNAWQREKRHNRTRLPTPKANLTFQSGLWDNIFLFLLSFSVSFLTPMNPLIGIFWPFFFGTVSCSQFIWPLSCSSRQHYALSLCSSPPNDGNQFSQEIRTSMTSRASSSRLIRPIWTSDKSKRFLPLVPSPEILLKICSCLLQSAPQFFYWCSFIFFFREGWVVMVVVRGVQQGDMLAWRRVQDGHGVGPLDKTLFTPLSLLFFLLESLTRKKNLRTDD